MPNGKPGDNPYTDLVSYHRELFGPEIDDKIRKIHSLAISPVQRHPDALVSNWPTEKGSPMHPKPLNPKGLSEALDTLLRVVEVMRTDT
jgi:hypothetical protein